MLTKALTLIALVTSVALSGCNQPTTAAESQVSAGKAAASATPPSGEEEKVLRIRNWPDYLPEGLLEEFELQTGIKVDYKTFASNEDVLAMVAKGNSDADIVVPSSPFAALLIKDGLARPLDRSLIPNAKHLDPLIMRLLNIADPGNSHLIPWAWGFTTVGINRNQVKAALGGTPLPANSWELVFNPAYTSKLKSCGIAFLDSPSEVIPAAAHYAGKAAYSNATADHQAAAEVLRAVRGDIRKFSSDLIDELSSGKLCAVMGWSGDINQAALDAARSGSSDVIEALIPSTGGVAFFDTMVILKSSKHPKNAHAFIDFMLRPENAARIVSEIGYATGNVAARGLVDKYVASNPSIFMSEDNINKLAVPGPYTMNARSSMVTEYIRAAYDIPIASATGTADQKSN